MVPLQLPRFAQNTLCWLFRTNIYREWSDSRPNSSFREFGEKFPQCRLEMQEKLILKDFWITLKILEGSPPELSSKTVKNFKELNMKAFLRLENKFYPLVTIYVLQKG